jgi:hypothetical protein
MTSLDGETKKAYRLYAATHGEFLRKNLSLLVAQLGNFCSFFWDFTSTFCTANCF